MADATVGVLQSTTPDRLIDNDSLAVGANTVYRQRVRIAGAAATDLATITNGALNVAVVPAVSTILNQASAAQTASGNSANLSTATVSGIAVDVNVTAVSGTTPTLNLFVDRLGVDGVWYQMWASAQMTAVGVASTSIGPGAVTAQSLASTARLRWVIGGVSPSFTFSASIVGR